VVLAQAGRSIQLAGVAASALSIDGNSVLWETIPGEHASTALVERNLKTRRTRTLARNVASLHGLVATTASIIYATATVPRRLVAIDRRSGRSTLLTDSLMASPLAWRGDRIAWAEEHGGRQRVVVYDLRRHKAWTAADLPNCVERLCYRVDAVTLAQRGVVFDRGAIGSWASFVVRRAFSAPHPELVKVERDPQPDLVPSALGALYYVLDRGWYRWDFGVKQPRRVGAIGAPSLYTMAYDGRRWLLRQRRGCDDAVVQAVIPGPITTVASPARARAVAGVETGVCVRIQSITWAGDRPVTTWIVIPRESHSAGATGVIVVGPPARSWIR
jgi:hypothetical protein